MRLHQLAGKWQAETKRLPLFRLLGSLEPIECKRLRLDVHAWPVVRYNDTCRSGRAISVDKHARSEEHTSELQSLMSISYAVFCLKKKKQHKTAAYKHHEPTTF